MIRSICLISADTNFGDVVRAVVGDLDAQLTVVENLHPGAKEVAATVAQDKPNLVIVGPQIADDLAVEILEQLDQEHPQITTLLVTPRPTAALWRRVLRAGARDLLTPDIAASELLGALADLLQVAERVVGPSLMNILNAAPAASGRLITVASPKGGCGKTMMSTNLAYALQQEDRGAVVLVDLDLQFGDVATTLQLRPEFNVTHAAAAASDPTAVKAFLTKHPSGFFALCGPANPVEAEQVDSGQLATLLQMLREEFPYVVVDTGAGMDDAALASFEASTDLVLMTTTDLAAINALRKTVVLLDQLKFDEPKRWFVLNRADARVGLDQKDIEQSTGLSIDITITSTRTVPVAMNKGTPVVQDDPRGAAARPLGDLVGLLTDRPADISKSWLKKRRSA